MQQQQLMQQLAGAVSSVNTPYVYTLVPPNSPPVIIKSPQSAKQLASDKMRAPRWGLELEGGKHLWIQLFLIAGRGQRNKCRCWFFEKWRYYEIKLHSHIKPPMRNSPIPITTNFLKLSYIFQSCNPIKFVLAFLAFISRSSSNSKLYEPQYVVD